MNGILGMDYRKRLAVIPLVAILAISSCCSLGAQSVSVLPDMVLTTRTKDKCRFVQSGDHRVLEIDEGGQAILALRQWNDVPPKGSVIQFKASIRSVSATGKEITVRCGYQLKEGRKVSANRKHKISPKSQPLTCRFAWDVSKSEIHGSPSFNISFWKPGKYTISSLDYSYYSLADGETTIAPLEGSLSLDDPNIHFRGTRYVRPYADHIEVDRFRPDYYQRDDLSFSTDKARSTSGVMLALRTTSPTVELSWGIEPHFVGRKADFAVLLDGDLTTTHSFRLTDANNHEVANADGHRRWRWHGGDNWAPNGIDDVYRIENRFNCYRPF